MREGLPIPQAQDPGRLPDVFLAREEVGAGCARGATLYKRGYGIKPVLGATHGDEDSPKRLTSIRLFQAFAELPCPK